MKRIYAIFLGLLLAAGLLGGCAGPAKAPVSSAPPGLSEDEARRILADAVAAGEEVLKKFYLSPSLKADAEDTLPGKEETYIRVTEEGFTSTADIKAATEKAFTPEAAAELFYAEYLEGDSPVYLDAESGLYEAADGGKNYTITWLTEEAVILSQNEDTLQFRVPRLQLEEAIADGELTLKKVQGLWLLDSGLEAV